VAVVTLVAVVTVMDPVGQVQERGSKWVSK
jgi:hypothetical protein